VSDATQTTAEPAARVSRRRLIGKVTKNRMDKTVVVEVIRYKMHTVYKKYVRVRKRYKAHDERNECRPGDRVEIVESRPMSKTKRFRVSRIVERPALQEA
jgi:small subunit ribosomal protein S17